MKFELDDDHYDFAEVVDAALRQHATPESLRSAWQPDAKRDENLRHILAEVGVSGLAVPIDRGGSGLDVTDCALVLELLGKYAVAEPHGLAIAVVAPLLARDVDEAVAGPLLERLAVGEISMTVQDGWGGWAPWAQGSDVVLVLGAAGEGGALVAPEPDDVVQLTSTDEARHIGRVSRSAHRLAEIPAAATQLARRRATVQTALELTGVATAMIDMAVEYAKNRHQFGRPIGSFQAVKHILADAYTAVQTSRRTAWWASFCLDTSDADAAEAVSVAKATIGDAARLASYAALQVYGGIGYTWECDLHLWMKRTQVLSASWGSTAEHLRALDRIYV